MTFAHRLKKITRTKKYYHVHLDSSIPGVVSVRERADTPEIEIQLLKNPWLSGPDELPTVIHPKRLSLERQWYLFDQIRQFCPGSDKDLTCPKPRAAKPTSRAGIPHPEDHHQQNKDVLVASVKKAITADHALITAANFGITVFSSATQPSLD